MRTTIRDIALSTGLSVSTVSLVLNHKEHRISEETCKRVFQAAKELNYRPNQAAVSLITKRTNTLGLIIPDITNVFFAEIAKGSQVRSQELGYSLILCNTNDNPEKDVDYVNV
ncbi:MAG: LacI family DNA-binding transcriptional regulator, partial [Oscillospiraceae bacterium]